MEYSVVIPLFNSEATIIDSVKSIENQTRYDLIKEIIIVDDGSTDKSLMVVEQLAQFNEKIKIYSQKNAGAASARNHGISKTSCRFVALLDSDDTWNKEKIEIQDRILEQNPDVKALGSNRVGEQIRIGKKIKDELYLISPITYAMKNWPCTPSLIFDKNVFSNDEYFQTNYSHAEEGLFFLKLANDCGLYYCTQPLVYCGGGKRTFGSSGLSGNIKLMHKGVKSMIREGAEKGYYSRMISIPLCLYEDLKYLRRIAITKFHK